MSYRSRLYNHRNAQVPEAAEAKPFFPLQHAPRRSGGKSGFFQAKAAAPQPAGAAPASPSLSQQVEGTKGRGESIAPDTRKEMQSSFGADFSNVSIHTDAEAIQMNKALHAQAFTHGKDIYFNKGKYDTRSTAGKKLLAHELTHVVQQQEGVVQRNMIQCDIGESLPTANGIFEFDSHAIQGARATPPTTQANLDVAIKFMPDTAAPYSNEIKLQQIIRDRDTSGNDIDIASMPPGRGASLRTTDDPATGVEGGFHTDVLHQNFNAAGPLAVTPPGAQKGMAYEGDIPVFGFKRSNDIQDIKAAEITDSPGSAGDRNFEFETVAKGEDTNQVYGALHWAFSTRSGTIINESVRAENTQSATFDAAAELHRNFYVHEPVVFYFDFDSDAVNAAEESKIAGFIDYLGRFPDVRLSLEGFADRQGDPAYNRGLSLRRAENVKAALLRNGIAESRIESILIGFGATEQFTSGRLAPNVGRSQDLDANRRGNRRVVLTFEHTASVSGP